MENKAIVSRILTVPLNLYGVISTPNMSIKCISNPNVMELTGNNFSILYKILDDFNGTQINIGIIVINVPTITTKDVLLFTLADKKAMSAPNRTEAITTDIKCMKQASSNVIG